MTAVCGIVAAVVAIKALIPFAESFFPRSADYFYVVTKQKVQIDKGTKTLLLGVPIGEIDDFVTIADGPNRKLRIKVKITNNEIKLREKDSVEINISFFGSASLNIIPSKLPSQVITNGYEFTAN